MDSPERGRQWADRTGAYSPAYYAGYGADRWSEAVRAHLDRVLDTDASVLELGCSSGRHLAHLLEHGYENLTGVDVNEAAVDVMADAFPALAETVTFHAAPIERVVADLPDDRFDAVFTVETLQHLPPGSAWVFPELARITADSLITVENEGTAATDGSTVRHVEVGDGGADGTGEETLPLYHRDLGRVFSAHGLEQVEVAAGGRNTVRLFRESP